MTDAEQQEMEDVHCNTFDDPQQERRNMKLRQAATAKLVAAMTDEQRGQRDKEDKAGPTLGLRKGDKDI